MHERLLVIACGALGREINALKRRYGWEHLQLRCLDPLLHNRPEHIPAALQRELANLDESFDRVFVAYADCGTGGGIDKVIAASGLDVERLPGAHCYSVFAGAERFAAMSAAEPGTFYLTDFLARHFERLVVRPLGLDRRPGLRDAYFGHYRRVVLLSQTRDAALLAAAASAATQLGLEFEHVHCGYGELENGLSQFTEGVADGEKDSHLLA